MPATAVTAMFTLQVPRLAQAPNPSLDTTHQTTSSGSYWADNGGSYTLTFEGSGTTIDLTDTHMYTGRYGNVDLFSFYGESSAQNTVYPYFNSRLTLRGAKGIHDPATLPGAADLPAYNDPSPYGNDQQLWIKTGDSYIWVYPSDFTVQIISSVPEPATYGMLAAGLSLIGLVARRRKSPTA